MRSEGLVGLVVKVLISGIYDSWRTLGVGVVVEKLLMGWRRIILRADHCSCGILYVVRGYLRLRVVKAK